MSKHTIKINEAYFADLGLRYRGEFSQVNDAISYFEKTKDVDQSLGNISMLNNAIKAKQQSLEYDINCISSVFTAADAEMKKRATELIGGDIINGVAGGGTVNASYFDPSLKPDLDSPRSLHQTQYGYETDEDGNLVWDHPKETEKYLYRNQGDAYKKFQGTCGLCTCANMLRLAGVNYDEKEMVDYASKHGLCETNSDPANNGGTSPEARKKILEHYGLKCSLKMAKNNSQDSVNDIAQYVSEGRGVNIAVYAKTLYNNAAYGNGTHSIVVTSVKKDSSGNILGFYVCDSNSGTPSYYKADVIKKALVTKNMVVTDSPIR